MLSIFLYTCEAWTLKAISAMEVRCYGQLLGTSYKEHIPNNEMRMRITQAIGLHMDLMTIGRRRKGNVWPCHKKLRPSKDDFAMHNRGRAKAR